MPRKHKPTELELEVKQIESELDRVIRLGKRSIEVNPNHYVSNFDDIVTDLIRIAADARWNLVITDKPNSGSKVLTLH